jgi:2',3'-cyclic-nucleotide 2'-phosphodiesterase (5'-nucleotidase family)
MRFIPFFLFSIVTLFGYSCHSSQKAVSTGPAEDGIIEFTFLQLNDVYEISPLSDGTGGLARVAGLRQQLIAENPNTITVLAGDFISPSVVGTLKQDGKRIRGKQMVETLNAIGVDYVVFGNHEFDYDYEDLQARLNESQFTWFGANARYQQPGTDGMVPFHKMVNGTREDCPDQLVRTLQDADGTTLQLGLFGVLINTGRKPWVVYSDWFETAKNCREQLRSSSELCIALTHLNVADDLQLAGMLPDIPLFMGGHDHENQIHKVGNATVAKADANAKTVYIHRIKYNKSTRKAEVRSELKSVDNTLPEEPQTAAVVAKWEEIKNKALASSGFNSTEVVTVLQQAVDCREVLLRRQPMPLGDILGSAMMAASQFQPEAALFNSGSVRIDDVLKGTLTEFDIVRMLPFGGSFVEVEMKGAVLRKVLETGEGNTGKGGYLQYHRIKKDGSGNWWVNNQPLNDRKTYKIALPDFLLTGNEQNMEFLKTTVKEDGTTNNPDILKVHRPNPKDNSDLRNDIRWALIKFWRGQ